MDRILQNLLNHFPIDYAKLQTHYSETTISRGVDYYEQGRVIQLELSARDPFALASPDVLCTATVAGTYASDYQTIVYISATKHGQFHVHSECSCPVFLNCKHGIAALFASLNTLLENDYLNTANPQLDAIEHWIKLVNADKEKRALPPSTQVPDNPHNTSVSPFHITYVLYLHRASFRTPSEIICVQAMRTRLLKSGAYKAQSTLNMQRITEDYYYHQPYVAYTPVDLEIIQAMQVLPTVEETGNSKAVYFKGEIGEWVLKKILQTGRAFWENVSNPPLTLSEKREVLLGWEDEGSYYRPSMNIAPFAENIIETNETFYYLDSESHCCGELYHTSMDINDLRYFVIAPPIEKAQAETLSRTILEKLPDIDMPLPSKIEVEDCHLDGVIASPVLHVYCDLDVRPRSPFHPPVYMLGLSFDYQGVSVVPSTKQKLIEQHSIVLQGNQRFHIRRDNATEEQAMQTLQSLGFSNTWLHCRNPMDWELMTQGYDAYLQEWQRFIEETIPDLRSQGWQIFIDDSFKLQSTVSEAWYGDITSDSQHQWFDVSLGIELEGKTLNLLPLINDVLRTYKDTRSLQDRLRQNPHIFIAMEDQQWVKIPSERMLQIVQTIIELYDSTPLEDGKLRLAKNQSLQLSELISDRDIQWSGENSLQELCEKLHDFSGIETVSVPQQVQAELRQYQQQGLNWLQFLRTYALNGILADDMGLGKTLQTLAHFQVEKNSGRQTLPNLVIAPTSLMSNWKNEINKFVPDLSVLVLHGPNRQNLFDQVSAHDIVLSTYPLILRDHAFFSQQQFYILVLDEAQAIKNDTAKTTQLINELNATHRLCLSGTPMENHLGELWSIFNFLMPGFLGNKREFKQHFRTPIELHRDQAQAERLRKRVTPFLLRRTKDQVAAELPEKTEIVQTIALHGEQRDLYESIRLAMDKKLRAEISSKGFARSQIMILDALLKLRQCCCDPRLLKLDRAKNVSGSVKLDLLMSLLPDMVEEGRKVLLFSQFTSMLSIIETALKAQKIKYSKLTGQTRKREQAINAFQEGDAKVFLISLKAGGVGLNLTAADTVIHYDPWWNPAAENQATDRAHRLGQDKPVFVYKLITDDTVEEKILAMQRQKQSLADALYQKKETNSLQFSQDDLFELLKPLEAP